MSDNAGNVYGTTEQAGAYGHGTVFELSPKDGSWAESTLYSFSGGTDGARPSGGLTLDASGNLYGTAAIGGTDPSQCGVVFKLVPSSGGAWTETVLHSFTLSDGCEPEGAVIFDNAGNLYGVTPSGGAYFYHLCNGYCGVVFKLTPDSGGAWNETVLHTFQAYGYSPQATPTLDPEGNLYGTTEYGTGNSGLVFEITP